MSRRCLCCSQDKLLTMAFVETLVEVRKPIISPLLFLELHDWSASRFNKASFFAAQHARRRRGEICLITRT